MRKVLLVDNYDSFTHNLVHLLHECEVEQIEVVRNDKFSLHDAEKFTHIMLSPGPGIPSEAGRMPALVERYAGSHSILGVCLGHQCIGEVFGASLVNMHSPAHAVQTPINVQPERHRLFESLPKRLLVGRYHSWVVEADSVPNCMEVTAVDDDHYVMAMKHRELDVHGVQFHPESILTPDGKQIVSNWLNR